MKNFWNYVSFALLLAVTGVLGAQEMNPTATSPQTNPAGVAATEVRDGVPVFKVVVVARDIPAINYFHRSGSTRIGFEGTTLLPGASGKAKVEAKGGRTSIEANFEGLTPANGFGPEYLTYVLWAITPEGRPTNLGEILPTGAENKNEITVTTNLQSCGLVVTAEPYFAVTMPSDLVVVQNVVTEKTEGVLEQVNAHYTLLPRGAYAETAGRHSVHDPIRRDERTPLELYEAVNAIEIAGDAGAGTYAADTMATAKTALKNAQDSNLDKGNRKETITFAREAVQSAEDARIITLRKQKAEQDAAQVKATETAELSAKNSQADAAISNAAAQKSQADAASSNAAAAKSEADAEQAKLAGEQEAAARAKADAAAAASEASAQAARDAQKAAEAGTLQATQQADVMREKLKDQLNQVLQTKETARGLIINMSDVLFDFNKYTLKPEAREKLAKVSGILLAYPNLKLQVEGYTDNVGSDEYNQKLSEQRAGGVRDYLVSQSVKDANITAKGFGKSSPVADNAGAAGRAENRRVELVVSGEAIGVRVGVVPGTE